jgi:hypothetical protein
MNELKRQFSKEVQMTKKYMKKCKSKCAKIPSQLVRMTVAKKISSNKCWRECGGNVS